MIILFSIFLFVILSFTHFGEKGINLKVFAIIDGRVFSKTDYFIFVKTDISFTLFSPLLAAGLLLVAFSREKFEDEYIVSLRLTSFIRAVLINYLILLFALLFVFDFAFLDVMVANMFTVLIIFIARFSYLLFINKRSAAHEK